MKFSHHRINKDIIWNNSFRSENILKMNITRKINKSLLIKNLGSNKKLEEKIIKNKMEN